jgi:hypothetical protein
MGVCALWLCLAVTSGARAELPADVSACVAAHSEAQRLRMGGQLVAAREQVLACAQRECPALVANDCALWLPELDAELPSVVLAVEGGDGQDLLDVRVFANDRLLTQRADGRALLLDPGSYQFRFEARGHRALTVTASVRQAEKNRLVRVRLEPELGPAAAAGSATGDVSPPAAETGSAPIAAYVFGGVAVAGVAAFTYFAVSGKNEHDRLSESCGRMCTPAQVEDGKRAYIIADVALAVGVASAITSAILFLTAGEDESAEEHAGATLRLGAGVDGGSLQWTTRH